MARIHPKHDFEDKLRQPSLLPDVKKYIAWKQACKRARVDGLLEPDMPALGPISINLDLTTACNFRCDHCIDWDHLNSKIKYEYEKLLASLGSMTTRGLRSVILIGGGEPTLFPKFAEVVRYLKERNVSVAVVSNGSRAAKILEIADVLSEKDWVRFSLDSGSNDTFIRMHKPIKEISLESICASVPAIRKRNPLVDVGFSFIITWTGSKRDDVTIVENIHEMVAATKLARDNGFTYISFKPFLTRFGDGGEVMDPSVMLNFQTTIARIRESIIEAKTYETDSFRVVESTNLKVLEQGTWRNFQNQPATCHMTAFRQVISPLGRFNCPAYRAVEKARIAGPKGYAEASTGAESQQAVAAQMKRFNAHENCANITCLYNPTNHWLEHVIESGVNPDALQETLERHDHYL